MKKLILPLFFLFLITACEKEEIDVSQIDLSQLGLKAGNSAKIDVCHYSEEDNTWHLINVSESAWKAHEKHGDIRLDDQDGDGFVPDNECGYGNMGDADDNDACVNPDNTSNITGIRLGGEPGDVYVGLKCNDDGTYRTCFYVSGTDLPSDDEKYHVKLNDVEYPVAFTVQISPELVVVCVTEVPTGETGVDVFVELGECVSMEKTDLYDAPKCGEITGIRLGGETGDAYVGPTCNEDGTYRTCFYLTGTDLPDLNPNYKILINGVEYPVAFNVRLSPTEVVVCATGLPAGETGVDVFIQLGSNISFEIKDMYDAPKCGEITDIRLGGQPGDAYVGPTCNNDGTYRTCFYITGTDLPDLNPNYKVMINGVEYPIAFNVRISPTEVVVCATGLPAGETGVDAYIQLGINISYEVTDFYDAPLCKPEITDFRLGGETGDTFVGPTCNADGTYRTTFYITGTMLPANQADYHIKLNSIEYPISFFTNLSPGIVVVGFSNLPSGEAGVDVKVMLPPDVIYEYNNFFDAPDCAVTSSLTKSASLPSFLVEK